jgi:hypothetical protein
MTLNEIRPRVMNPGELEPTSKHYNTFNELFGVMDENQVDGFSHELCNALIESNPDFCHKGGTNFWWYERKIEEGTDVLLIGENGSGAYGLMFFGDSSGQYLQYEEHVLHQVVSPSKSGFQHVRNGLRDVLASSTDRERQGFFNGCAGYLFARFPASFAWIVGSESSAYIRQKKGIPEVVIQEKFEFHKYGEGMGRIVISFDNPQFPDEANRYYEIQRDE